MEQNAMDSFQIRTTVAPDGGIHVAGLPFSPGTQVHVVMNPSRGVSANETQLAVAKAEMSELFRTVKGFRLGEKIPREELHERGSLR
jgi:hypothetical protein